MKKLWMIIALVLIGIVAFFGFTTWQQSQKHQLSTRTFTVQTADLPSEYTEQIGASIERNVKAKLKAMTFDMAAPVYESGALIVDVPNGITNDRLLTAFNQELDFAVMQPAPLEEADVVLFDTEGFKATSITGPDIYWVEVAQDSEGKAAMRIVLTEEGQQELQELFRSLTGQQVGLFIRNQLVAKLLVPETEFEQDIRVFNIPDRSLATTVADDLLIGRYVTFSQ